MDPYRVSVAPMMEWTDRHCRYFMRLLSPSALLYTEMVTAAALHHGNHEQLLQYDAAEHPLALQLGGSEPSLMAEAAMLGQQYGYDEININVGCPSDRVQSGQFGACLMASPQTVAACVQAMRSAVDLPVTVKTRIGIDDRDDYEFLTDFIDAVAAVGCRKFIVHARIAILSGLSPKENRTIPPLNYERVYRIKQDYPQLDIVLNGGLETIQQIDLALSHVDAVMIGRQAYHRPYLLSELERHFNPDWSLPSRQEIVQDLLPYIEREVTSGTPLHRITRHIMGLFAGVPGARIWRRHLSENSYAAGAGPEVLLDALTAMSQPV
ncbi:MAG: tRNA dihydrouridine(20/20a) synthase DusA [bacterium]|nr:tRNA dihydrouridine(20/20a) synthase DusA [bacterium]